MNYNLKSTPKRIARQNGALKRADQEVYSNYCLIKYGNHSKTIKDIAYTSFTVARPYDKARIHFKSKKEKYFNSNQKTEEISRIKHARKAQEQQNIALAGKIERDEAIIDIKDEIKKCKEFIYYRMQERENLKRILTKNVSKLEILKSNIANTYEMMPNANFALMSTLNERVQNLSLLINQQKHELFSLKETIQKASYHLRNLEYDLELEQEK